MTDLSNIAAVMFDMDGTLVDSELMTEPVIRSFCNEAGLGDVDYRWSDFHGVTWKQVARRIASDHSPDANIADIARQLHRLWERMCNDSPPTPVPGAREAVMLAHARMPTAIVSSAYRESIDRMIWQMELKTYVTCRIGAEDYGQSKPAPDGFLHAARILGVAPQACLVFEDSLAGLRSARAAGMAVIAITHRSNALERASALADYAISDFTELRGGFFSEIARPAGSAGQEREDRGAK